MILKKNGFDVKMYESRQDMRIEKEKLDRSINLTISDRGVRALKYLEIDEKILANGIKLHSRMIHTIDGSKKPSSYGNDMDKEYIISMDRNKLNMDLLTEAEKIGVEIHFKLIAVANLDLNEVIIKTKDNVIIDTITNPVLIVGSDGTFSTTRHQIMKHAIPAEYEQTVIPHCYKQLMIGANSGLDPNHLHIWPRGTLMLIAMVNTDGTFTCTLFMPKENFDNITSDSDLIHFFKTNFPDALELIGEQT